MKTSGKQKNMKASANDISGKPKMNLVEISDKSGRDTAKISNQFERSTIKISEKTERNTTNVSRRSAVKIMAQLVGLVRPLLPVMTGAILMGTAGYLCAISLTVIAVQILLGGLAGNAGAGQAVLLGLSAQQVFVLLVILAVLRGILHYAEQYCNHFIAFKLLAIIRHKVFAALGKLCPAKLEGRDRGNLISIITTDIELLEVFYAHTISPAAIAVLTCLIMVCFAWQYHPLAGLWAAVGYTMVGIGIPLWIGRHTGGKGMEFRTAFGALNSFVLDSLRGIDETIQYGHGEDRRKEMERRTRSLAELQRGLSRMEGIQRMTTNLAILVFSFGMLFGSLWLYGRGEMEFAGVLTCTVLMMGSFGPTAALSNLSNNLHQTLASGERVLSILEEKPMVEEIPDTAQGKIGPEFLGASADNVSFSYENEEILKDFHVTVKPGKILGIHGASGCGKSTLLKLFMRFWDVQKGSVSINEKDVRQISTGSLRSMQAYVTQETHLFHDSIANNIAVGKPQASREEIIEAAKKASLHDFIMELPDGYDTEVGELGDTLSGGERQRIGIARAFLYDAPFWLLDEPTSNLDSLNEGIILKSLTSSCKDKTVILVSHRRSTLNAADEVLSM